MRNLSSKVIALMSVSVISLFGAGETAGSEAAKLACTTVNVDAYYSQYDATTNYWSYVDFNQGIIFAHKAGSNSSKMGTEFFPITGTFASFPTKNSEGTSISFPTGGSSNTKSTSLSNATIDVDAYYSQYDETTNYWSYVDFNQGIIFAHKAGSNSSKMGTEFFPITGQFETFPTKNASGTTITFGALKGQTCSNTPIDPNALEAPPSPTTTNTAIELPPQVPSLN